MAILKRKQSEIINEHTENDTGHYTNVKKWLSRIHKVVDIDTKQEWKLDAECKLIYGYLFGFGNSQGWDNIYPNQDLMSKELGIGLRSMVRKIKVLGECGLIDVIHTTDKSKFGSNRYRVKQPRHVPRRKWVDIEGVYLKGKLYKWDRSMFNKVKEV